ncbi:MAG: hypothetical protein Q9202_004114 [Teloschistes flavicans]
MRYRWRPSSTAQLPFQQLLENNDLGIIDNPLRRIPEKHLREFIDSFFKDSELAKVTNFTNLFRGARLARDEEAFGQEDTLTDVEKAALEKEKSRDPEEDPKKDRRREPSLWAESREIKIILLICCVASITQGWAQAAIVGANQGWPRALNLQLGQATDSSDKATKPPVTGDVWRFSATNAIVYFAASSVGAYLSDPLTDILMGRRGAIFIAALSTFTASIGQAYAQSWRALFAWRL